MNCVKCGKETKEIGAKELHTNLDNGQEYERTLYHCQNCDIWMNVEIPVKVKR